MFAMSIKANVSDHIKRRRGATSFGQKKPFLPGQIQLIRSNLAAIGDTMQIALFEAALSSMLRAGDLLRLPVGHVLDHYGQVVEEFYVKQEKTTDTVKCFLGSKARAALRVWIDQAMIVEGKIYPGRRLFSFTRQHYGRLVKGWALLAHLDPKEYSTHSMRRTAAAHIFRKTNNIEAVRHLLGHQNLSHTQAYLGVTKEDAIKLAKEHEL